MLTLPVIYQLNHVNVFALVKNGKVSLIDTGPNLPEIFPILERLLGEIGCQISDIDQILITHAHADHCGLAGAIQDISGATVLMSEMEYKKSMVNADMVIESMKSFYRQVGLPDKVINRGVKPFMVWANAIHPFMVNDFLVPGEIRRIKNELVEVIGCPGHTTGQVIFFIRERGLLFSGDHVLTDIMTNLSLDPTVPLFRPLRNYVASLDHIMGLPVSVVYPAHGKPFTDLMGRIVEIKAQLDARKNLIMTSVNAGSKTADEISGHIFGVDITAYERILAFNEIYVYLLEINSGLAIERQWVNRESAFIIA